jgi:hypothetical protein
MSIWNNFNAAEIEPAQSRDVLPAGKYIAVITRNETKPTKSGTGERLNFTFEIVEGEHKGRKVWAGLNVKNANPDAEKIALSELSSICRAVGIMTPRGPDDLHDKPMEIEVKVRAADANYAASNEIVGYKPTTSAATAQAPKPTVPWRK